VRKTKKNHNSYTTIKQRDSETVNLVFVVLILRSNANLLGRARIMRKRTASSRAGERDREGPDRGACDA